MKRRIDRWCLPVVFVLASAATVAFGQNAQLSGKVTDPTGAVVPGADITITNSANGAERKAATNGEGNYIVPALQPGNYKLVAVKQGFSTEVREGLTLQVGDNARIDMVLKIGSTSETVEVSAGIPLLRVDDAQTGLVIDNRRIEELPQYNRNVLAFEHLAPTVSGTADNPSTSTGGNVSDFRINGGRSAGSEYTVDGIPMTEGYTHNISGAVLSPEAVQEFKVITNGMTSEYGRLSGGEVDLATRAGSDKFHGSAYEFVKNQLFNANGWFNNYYGTPRNTFHYNIFGGSLGGRLWIPKIYNAHKSYVFFSYEGTRYSGDNTATIFSTPTDLEKQGDFSQTLETNGKGELVPAVIYDWKTGVLQPNGSIVRQPFDGAKIPSNRIDAIAKLYNAYYPEPNLPPAAGTTNTNNYAGVSQTVTNDNKYTGRFDQIWSPSQMTYFTITVDDSVNNQTGGFGSAYPSTTSDQISKVASIHHLVTLHNGTVVEAWGGVLRDTGPGNGSPNQAGVQSLSSSINSQDFGFSSQSMTILGTVGGRLPNIVTNSPTQGLGGGGGSISYETDYHAGVSVQKLINSHNLKFGFQHHRYYTNVLSGGNLTFGSDPATTSYNPNVGGDGTGDGYASFLMGTLVTAAGNQYAGPASRQTAWDAYGLDSWKVNKNLTVNVGVRWDYEPPRTERHNRQVFWDTKYNWNLSPAAGWSWQNNMTQAGIPADEAATLPQPSWMANGFMGRPAAMGTKEYPQRTIQESYPYDFSPHIGLVYQFAPHTVVRASYGLNYMTLIGNMFLNSAAWNNGYGGSMGVERGTSDNGLTYTSTLENPTPNGAGYHPYVAGSEEQTVLDTALGAWYVSEATNTYPGLEHTAQLSVEQEVGRGQNAWVFELSGGANLGRKLPWWLGPGMNIMPGAYDQLGFLGNTLDEPVTNPVYNTATSAPIVPGDTGYSNTGPTTQLGRIFTNNPLFSESWTMGSPYGTSNYEYGYFKAEHRFGNSFSLLATYTWSRIKQDLGDMNNSQLVNPDNNGYPQAGRGLHDVYGVAPNDRTNKFLVNYSVDLPVGKGKRLLGSPNGAGGAVLDKVLSGWTWAGTTTYLSGTPLNISGAGSPFWSNLGLGRNAGSIRPIFLNYDYRLNVSGHAALPSKTGTYFNTTSFATAGSLPGHSPAEIGNVPSTLSNLRGPGYNQWDMALMKSFKLWSESSHFVLRGEAQNVFNHVDCSNPDTKIGDGTYGHVESQANSPRVLMVAGKIVF
jgi:hypothetical protein